MLGDSANVFDLVFLLLCMPRDRPTEDFAEARTLAHAGAKRKREAKQLEAANRSTLVIPPEIAEGLTESANPTIAND